MGGLGGKVVVVVFVVGMRVRGRLDLSVGKGEFLRIYKKDFVMVLVLL